LQLNHREEARVRIQQTDRILKEARAARHSRELHAHEHESNIFVRAWRALLRLFKL
jgi:hypothetical protein